MKIGVAKQIAGTLSYPSKMPGTSYALPASACVAGSKLANVAGTVCAACYALKGMYMRGTTLKAMRRRLAAISGPLWIEAMVTLLAHEHSKPRIKVDLGEPGVRAQRSGGSRFQYNEPGWHRWHDSGDLQSVDHFAAICEIAKRTPQIKHWLPTQELGMVQAYVGSGRVIPGNLVVRVSSIRIDDHRRRSWLHTSSVFSVHAPTQAYVCPAPSQDHRCMTCRACWSKDVRHVAYRMH